MNQLVERSIDCPYCGEHLHVLIDTTDIGTQYIEDCQVCCRPITFLVTEDSDEDYHVNIFSEDESF
ncbi:CPXCG motif-containing cysteine-rich protein [Vibrio amylolyticus]|uniref:CPXCG motif-containing cysteine-rich protein n=1 Tax=Vibrio amylolyticus TaxID=2847292 RepID=UPI00354F82B9